MGGVLPGQIARMLTSSPASVLSCLVKPVNTCSWFFPDQPGASNVIDENHLPPQKVRSEFRLVPRYWVFQIVQLVGEYFFTQCFHIRIDVVFHITSLSFVQQPTDRLGELSDS